MLEFGDQIPPQVCGNFYWDCVDSWGRLGGSEDIMGTSSDPPGVSFLCGVQRILASFPDTSDELSNCCLSASSPPLILPTFDVTLGVVSVKSQPVLESVCFCTNIHYASAFFILLVW